MKNSLKNLILVFSTFIVEGSEEKYAISRQEEYGLCYRQLMRVIPENFDVIFVDNSIESLDTLASKELINFLKSQNLILTKKNFGAKNKGVGELAMLVNSSQLIDFSAYNVICYCTGRKFFTCPYPFEKAASSNEDAVVSNPDFLFLDGNFIESAKGMFNDMFFSMKSEIMIKFIEYTFPKLQLMERFMINSETNLYQFIHEKNISHQILPSLGIIRNGLLIKDAYNSIGNFHFC